MSSPIKRDVINTQISALLPEGTQDSPISTNARVLKNLKAAFSSFSPDAQTVKIQTQADLQPVPMMKALTFKSKGLSLRSTTSKPNSVCDYKSDTKDPWNRPLVEQQKQQARNLMVTLNREVSKLEREQSREKKRRLATEFSLNYGSKFEEEIINRGQAIKMDRAARRIQKWFRFKKSKVNLVLKLRSIVLAVVRLQKMNKTWAFKKNLANRILYRRNTASFVV